MPDYKKVLDQAAAGAGLGEDLALIRAFHKIGSNWVTLAEKLKVTTIDDTISTIMRDLNGPAVQQGFTDLGLATELATLKRLAARLGSAAGEIPASVKQLLRPLSDFDEAASGAANPGKIDWDLIDAKHDLSTGDDLSLAVSASGGLGVEAGDTWPFKRDKAPDPLLRLGLSGKIGGSAGATVPYAFGSVGASGTASAEAGINYYLDARQSRALFGIEVGESLARLPDPFDFEAVWRAFAGTSLYGITYDFTGAAKAGVTISLAHGGSWSGINAGLGVTIGATFTLDSKYSLSFRRGGRTPTGESEIVATLSRARSNASEVSAKIGVSLDLAKLAGGVHELLKRAIGHWDAGLKELKPFLSPGTWLQTQASDLIEAQATALIGTAGLKEALIRDLRGSIGIETSDSALVEWLVKEMSGALDQASGVLTAKVDDAAKAASAALGARLPALSQTNIRQPIEASLKKLITDLRASFEKEVKKAIASAGGDLQKALNKAGATASATVTTLNDALKPLRELLEKYDKLFQKILAEFQNAARRKISANLLIREARSNGENIEIVGTFRGSGADAKAVFTALTLGRLDAIRALFTTEPGGDFALDPGSSLKRMISSSSELGLELVLFNFGISGKELLEADVSVEVDGEGNLFIDTSAKLTKIFDALSEAAELSFVDTFSIARARAVAGIPGASTRKLEAGVTVTHRDNGLKRSEVEGFVRSLEAANLLINGSTSTALAKFDSWSGPGSQKPLAAHLTAKLWLTSADAVAMMQLDKRTPAGLSEKAKLRIAECALESLRASGDRHFNQRVEPGIEVAAGYLPRGQYSHAEIFLRPQPRLTPYTEPRESKDRDSYKYFLQEQERMLALVGLFELMGTVYLAEPADPHAPRLGSWTDTQYHEAQRELVRQSRGWLTVDRKFLFWLGSEVHPRTIALIKTMTILAGRENSAPLALIMTRKDKAKGDETFALAGPGA